MTGNGPSTSTSTHVHPEQATRYSRQELFAPIGGVGQKLLSNSRILIIGAGALGTANAESLVRAGVGYVRIVDRDYVEWSNLQRQQLFSEQDALTRMPKAVAAQRRLQELNSAVVIDAHVMDVTLDEIESLVHDIHVIIDATDNFDTRLLINDISQKHRIPWIYGGCVGSYGITYTIRPGYTPCLNCLLGATPLGGDTCDTSGIIPPAVHMVAAHQTTETIKLLTQNESALRGTLLSFDVWRNEQASIKVGSVQREDCLSCGPRRNYPFLSASNLQKTEVLCGRDTVQIRPASPRTMNLLERQAILQQISGARVEINPFLLSFHLQSLRLVLFQDGRALVHGTKDVAEAKTFYNKYVGS
ncbi:molybdopterin/thiamine biosynthesis adenylyltransferase [Paenibacillus shirakamiensis]|uniref:Molybdopterin/thiamine biosynthesis adenylyltransferase n=1 Tax=Paenibacillus shirakamiensis TaxID=1265935 RepID=A0ABS4JFH0_9BACL|nr:ThiF family adenylyltransferase [Paenibacillus shirakamiensis]MBP1999810.1 molybdopterin/thiamine biosynthesis adenylyltransferase [Paenibacillus shirakamiensis]